jgi:hypothetical protein
MMRVSNLAVQVWAVVAPLAVDSFVPMLPPVPIVGPSFTISSSSTRPHSAITIDKEILQSLEQETRAAENEAKADERKAQVEKSLGGFFKYEAKMAAEQEARIEAAEQKALAEATKDKMEADKLKAMELKVEEEAVFAKTKQEKATKLKEARVSCYRASLAFRVYKKLIEYCILLNHNIILYYIILFVSQKLLAQERELERKEKRAERSERIFMAEEEQQKKILAQKADAARAVSILY